MTGQPSDTPRKYYDMDGVEVTLLKLVRMEPGWAANQIRQRDDLERRLAAAIRERDELKTEVANLTSSIEWHNDESIKLRDKLIAERDDARAALREIHTLCQHGIDLHRYVDNMAACQMAGIIESIERTAAGMEEPK